MLRRLLLALLLVTSFAKLHAAEKLDTTRGDQMLKEYFAAETAKLAGACLADVQSREDWESRRGVAREQLFEMLGLSPLPEKTPLKVTVTGRFEQPAYTVENLHYQSRPGLYVTGNLYLPKGLTKPAPAILYVCGHARVKKGDTSYGGKTHYHFHADWFARHGYVCLTIDTLQLGEIEGIHHGTFNRGMWWWNARGYTSAGVEAWNCIRALDLLQSRPEVDGERLGVTGRSGGGAYSWWIAALDERIKAAVPVAGITDLTNHVVDGTVEGHCDCMFMVNTYRWDYAQVAALVAPRAQLITNTDKDGIFPLDGVTRLHAKVAKLYKLYGVPNKLGLQISEGGHNDIPELQLAAFRWFNRHLKNEDPPIESAAKKVLQPEQLQVFKELPIDQQNTRIHEVFVPQAPVLPVPQSASEFAAERDAWRQALDQKVFRGWPTTVSSLNVTQAFSVENDGMRFTAYDFTSQEHVRLRLYELRRAAAGKNELAVLNALDDEGWRNWLATMRPGFAAALADETLPEADAKGYEQLKQMFKNFRWTMTYVAPRGVGPTAFDQSTKKQTQIRRRFNLLGQTLESMQVYDVRRAIQALRTLPELQGEPLWLQGDREAAGLALYASLYEPDIVRLDLWHLPRSHRDGPSFLNVLRFLDVPQALAMAGERSQIRIYQRDTAGWEYPVEVAKQLKWSEKQLVIRQVKAE